jgi:tetratricopeptide (TPR) repeat protein
MLRLLATARARTVIASADRARDARRWARAARLYRRALARNPENPPIWVQYGHALKEAGRHEQAEAAYRSAIRCDPSSADAHLQLGHVLKIRGKPGEAELCYLLAAAFDPSMPDSFRELRGLGWSGFAASELRRAAAPEAEAASTGPSQAVIYSVSARLSEVRRRASRTEAAAVRHHTGIAVLRRAISRVRRDPTAAQTDAAD